MYAQPMGFEQNVAQAIQLLDSAIHLLCATSLMLPSTAQRDNLAGI
jgi:hypothetical protein